MFRIVIDVGTVSIYIYKEELKTVVRQLLACSSRARNQISRGVRNEKPENDRPPFWFYGDSIRTSVHGSYSNGGNAQAAHGVVAYDSSFYAIVKRHHK